MTHQRILFVGAQVKIDSELYSNFLTDDEEIGMQFGGIQNTLMFTDLRIVVVESLGNTRMPMEQKAIVISIPWKSISTYSLENHPQDLNSREYDFCVGMKISGSGFGTCELRFTRGHNMNCYMKDIAKFVNERILSAD